MYIYKAGTHLGTLEEVDSLLDNETRWVQNDWSVDAGGNYVPPRDPRACRWCLSGACSAVDLSYEEENFLDDAAKKHYGQTLVGLNDEHDFSVVKFIIEEAIKMRNASNERSK